MYFVAFTSHLHATKQSYPLTVADAPYAHAAIIHALSRQSPDLARTLHDMQRNKCVAIAILNSNSQSAILRLSFMAADGLDYLEALMNEFSRQPTLRLNSSSYEIASVDLCDREWAAVNTWADLIASSTNRFIRFTFVTPTAIMKRDDSGGRFTATFPEPNAIFPGLKRRWDGLDGPSLTDSLGRFLIAGGCVVADYELHTETFQTSERTQKGFCGWVLYECRRYDPACIFALNALARFAFFTGVGYQTARGMGVVKSRLSN